MGRGAQEGAGVRAGEEAPPVPHALVCAQRLGSRGELKAGGGRPPVTYLCDTPDDDVPNLGGVAVL